MKILSLSLAVGLAVTALGVSARAQSAGGKVAIINIQEAITRTQEGQKLIQGLQQRYKPQSDTIQQQQQEINDLRAQLNKGANTMSEDARRNLMRDIQQKERDAQRAVEDAQAEFNREQQQIFNDVGSKLMNVIAKYATDNGYSIVLDISSPQSPVLYAVNEANITTDIIQLYDQQGGAAASGGGPASKPAK